MLKFVREQWICHGISIMYPVRLLQFLFLKLLTAVNIIKYSLIKNADSFYDGKHISRLLGYEGNNI